MAKEIERRFLVRELAVVEGRVGQHIVQGYPPLTPRVRIKDGQAFLTLKGASDGMTCDEFEYPIPMKDAQEMMALSGPRVLEKMRYEIEVEDRKFEVDVFRGRHTGLVLAEVELPSADALVAIPDWAGEEVTGDFTYANSNLADMP